MTHDLTLAHEHIDGLCDLEDLEGEKALAAAAMKTKVVTVKEDITALRIDDVVYYRGLRRPFRVKDIEGDSHKTVVTLVHTKTGKAERITTRPRQIEVWRVLSSYADLVR